MSNASLLWMALAGCGGSPVEQAAPAGIVEDMVPVAAGAFTMGTDPDQETDQGAYAGFIKEPYANEAPQRVVEVPAFRVDRLEVVFADYKRFLDATGRPPPKLLPADFQWDRYPSFPVHYVNWEEATAYCAWRGARLPTEAEWEKAARGTDGRRYPWGADYDPKQVASHTSPWVVGHFPTDTSPYGAMDMGGNVSEWTSDWYKQYPGNNRFDADYGESLRSVRGGSWGGPGHYNLPYLFRAASRRGAPPDEGFNDVGFRCVRDGTPA